MQKREICGSEPESAFDCRYRRLLGKALSRIEDGEDYAKSYVLGVMNDSLLVAAKLKGLQIDTCPLRQFARAQIQRGRVVMSAIGRELGEGKSQ